MPLEAPVIANDIGIGSSSDIGVEETVDFVPIIVFGVRSVVCL